MPSPLFLFQGGEWETVQSLPSPLDTHRAGGPNPSSFYYACSVPTLSGHPPPPKPPCAQLLKTGSHLSEATQGPSWLCPHPRDTAVAMGGITASHHLEEILQGLCCSCDCMAPPSLLLKCPASLQDTVQIRATLHKALLPSSSGRSQSLYLRNTHESIHLHM